jgi:hypothetical protein
MNMSPLEGTMPAIALSNEDLPAPLGPITQIHSPSEIVIETSLMTAFPPRSTRNFLTVSLLM